MLVKAALCAEQNGDRVQRQISHFDSLARERALPTGLRGILPVAGNVPSPSSRKPLSKVAHMPTRKRFAKLGLALTIAAAIILATTSAKAGQKEYVLHNFGSGNDGTNPSSVLIPDSTGNLYGTTAGGGAHGFGTVFMLTANPPNGWKETILYSFKGGRDGLGPHGGLAWDSAGNLYGTTLGGGAIGQLCKGTGGCGTVFELSPLASGKWQENVLYRFKGCQNDGCHPTGGVVFDSTGNLYSTTTGGGDAGCGIGRCGTVFELTRSSSGWRETVIYHFRGVLQGDGSGPQAGLTFDSAGDLLGTTLAGGTGSCKGGCGTVFELTPTSSGWQETVLHSFAGGSDGAGSWASLSLDVAAGILYSTTSLGGPNNHGTVFQLAPGSGGGWTEEVLHSFSGGKDGSEPFANVILDSAGNLYGTTVGGGNITCDCGTVFKLVPGSDGKWTESVLHNFVSGNDGANPQTGLLFDTAGNLYGTTSAGGNHNSYGTAFEITAP